MNMTEESVFAEALEKQNAQERAAFLDRVCAGRNGLRQSVESLLSAYNAGEFLEAAAPGLNGTVEMPPLAEKSGTIIGPYKLMEQIGEGGMGLVFVAEQLQPVRRKVALKVIKPGMDTREVIARFEAERQALAMMDHINIAKVLEAGTTDSGRPYFVMELVHGVPITKYCDNKRLTLSQRLELFIPVCLAVQHAHQKGVIHRDIKPSNVMVTMYDDKPVPKIIDFGVAKAIEQRLTEKSLYTNYGALVGTFEYMSPEQAEMNAFGVDTRSDIYSLGVLLYELLTGTTPLERQRLRETAYGEIIRLIKEEEPVRPSLRLSASGAALADISRVRGIEPAKLTKVVRGDLDWIVLRCLEKDRARRYETATGLAKDVEHYLKDEPVEACPPTAGYRLRKFVRKNQKLLATAAAFAALLVVGAAGSTWHSVRATQAETAAVANEQRANANAEQAKKNEQEAKQQRDEVRELNDKLQRTLYISQMNLAKHAWDASNVGRSLELLNQNVPKVGANDPRGFEWHYLNRLCNSQILTLKGDKKDVFNSLSFSPDGKYLAACSREIGVKLWDSQSGKMVLNLKQAGLDSFAFSPDGKLLASSGTFIIDKKDFFKGVFLGEKVPTSKELKIWDAETGQETLLFADFIGNLAFSPDGSCLAGHTGVTARILDAQSGKVVHDLKHGTLRVERVAFSPDGKRLATGSRRFKGGKGGLVAEIKENTCVVKIWNTETGEELLSFNVPTDSIYGEFPGLAFSPDGKRLVTATLLNAAVWDAETGKENFTLKGHAGYVWRATFSPDGERIATCSEDRSVKVWDAHTGQELQTFRGHNYEVWAVAFSPDGKRLASASPDGTVLVWDAQTNQDSVTVKPPTGVLSGVALSADGRYQACVGLDRKTVKVLAARTGQLVSSFIGGGSSVQGISFSANGQRLAGQSLGNVPNSELKVWDSLLGRELLTVQVRANGQLALSPDGGRLAWAQNDTVKVWDVQTGQELLNLKTLKTAERSNGIFFSIAFSPDGKRLACGFQNGKLIVWDSQTGQELLARAGGQTYPCLSFSPDGRYLASGCADGPAASMVKLWDIETGKEFVLLKGHVGRIESIAFSPDGKRLSSASRDQTVKLWDVETGQETLTLKGTMKFNALAFTPDGHRLVSCGVDGTIIIWDATPLAEKK